MRSSEVLKKGFRFKKFALGEAPREALLPDYNDSEWEAVRVPHDWAIREPFGMENDSTLQTILEDGILKPIGNTGRTGGLPIVGEGVYRKWIEIPAEDEGKAITLEFDGVMMESTVYCNGKPAGGGHFGYFPFEADISGLLEYGKPNLIAVHAIVRPDSCRWYPGAGLYRNVRLVKKPAAHLVRNGVWVRQLVAGRDEAIFELTAEAACAEGQSLTAMIYTPDGRPAAMAGGMVQGGMMRELFHLPHPALWDIDSPQCYRAVVTMGDDRETVSFGVRTVTFSPEGMALNGRALQMKGVCMHHDLGALGAAVSVPALRRQLTILRGMGVNAIRTSHNPPAPELLQLCDEMGFLVIDEFFDEWRVKKVANGYARFFEAHAEADTRAIIRRDRNHPCVILWSLGNEIREQRVPDGWRTAKQLNDIAHAEDPTRPTTAGLCNYPDCFKYHIAFYMDVVGLNYKPEHYRELHEKYPQMILVGSETESCVSTRGVYHLPAETEIPAPVREDLTVSAYELSAPRWAYYPERELAAQQDCPFVLGEFIWTGFDYLGEPTPYYKEWPSRSSYFGVVDLAGLPKNRYYAYRAAWTDIPTLHLFPHWNWEGHEGERVPIHVYTNYPEVEVFINGISQGRKRHGTENEISRFRLIWNDTVYTPGEVTAVAYDAQGREAEKAVVRTAGAPAKIRLTAEREILAADGEDLCYVTAAILDENDVLCPHAANRLTFSAEGPLDLLTTDAGDQRETESFARPDKKALAGLLVACLRTREGARGKATVTCTAPGLETGAVTLKIEHE